MKLEKIYKVDAPILLIGETGTGKSRLAKIIHDNSGRSKFIIVHLASLNETLLGSELFGHMKGAFTGAIENKKGYCETVERGTLFLDEIGELSLDAQKKLLFLIEERKFYPVGSCNIKDFKGTIIAATNRDLKNMVSKGQFREDLYYRLMVYGLKTVPLRNDKKKILELMGTFISDFKKKLNKGSLVISNDCRNYLLNYHWPGNIRELKNALEYLVTFCENKIEVMDLPAWMLESKEDYNLFDSGINIGSFPLNYKQAKEVFERKYFSFVLEYFDGKINHTAEELKISKSTLIAKIRRYGINVWQIKAAKYEF